MALETLVSGFRLIELVAGAFATGSVLVGLYIGFRATQSFRRHSDPSMRYLAAGLVLLTAVTYSLTFVGSVLLQLRLLTLPQQDYILTLAHLTQFAGLFFIAYALHRRPK